MKAVTTISVMESTLTIGTWVKRAFWNIPVKYSLGLYENIRYSGGCRWCSYISTIATNVRDVLSLFNRGWKSL